MAKKKKIMAGLYEYEGFTISRNVHKEYGMPRSAWVISDDREELGPARTLSDAITWIGAVLTDPFGTYRRKK